jgi:hypothetical protein
MEWRSGSVKTKDRFQDSVKAGRFKKPRSCDCDGDRRDSTLRGNILPALMLGFIL